MPLDLQWRAAGCAATLLAFLVSSPAFAQADEQSAPHGDHKHTDGMTMDMPKDRAAKPAARLAGKKRSSSHHAHDHQKGIRSHEMAGQVMNGHDMNGHDMGQMSHAMASPLGPYAMTRDGSGTSWLPDTSPHEGIYRKLEDWSVMSHGVVNLIYDNQGGPRGAHKTFASGMLMTMMQRPLGDGTFGVRAMLSPEPFMGANGYPLLLATGETANGTSHLVDRQHPHDLFMELAATYSQNLTANSSVFVYGGLPGEPALGPPAFMHRTSGADNPEAPISHHWLDSTHITFGVLTAGVVMGDWKIEGSSFRGREPDQYRYDIERPYLDSFAGRVSWNPAREWSFQVSYGHLNSPEQLAPTVNENRLTASGIYTTTFGGGNVWSTTVAWGRKMLQPGDVLDAWLIESALILQNNVTLFMRGERVQEGELTEDIPGLEGRRFTVGKVSVGGIYDFVRTEHAKFGLGGLVSQYALPHDLVGLYGKNPTSFMVFGRLKML